LHEKLTPVGFSGKKIKTPETKAYGCTVKYDKK